MVVLVTLAGSLFVARTATPAETPDPSLTKELAGTELTYHYEGGRRYEVRFSAEAGLLIAHKWSKPGLVKSILRRFESDDASPEEKAAAREFRAREREGRLVEQRDPEHRIGTFAKGRYAEHRYSL